jgi:hypothetical protein
MPPLYFATLVLRRLGWRSNLSTASCLDGTEPDDFDAACLGETAFDEALRRVSAA